MRERAVGRIDGGDVEALDSEFRRALAGRYLLAGKHANQLLGTAGRVARRHGDDFVVLGEPAHCRLHCRDGFRLVVLDADQDAARAKQVTKDRDTANDFFGALAHQHVVAGHVRLALGAVDDEILHRYRSGRRQFRVAGKGSAAETDDTGIAQEFAHPLGRQAPMIEGRARYPLVATIGLDDDAECRQPRRVCRNMVHDGQDSARGRRMHGRRHPAVGTADQLPLEDVLSGLDARCRRATDTLMQGNVKAGWQRRLGDRFLHRRRLVRLRFDATLEAEQSLQHCGRLTRHA